ncbi:hypothetical protein [Pseudomonas frederiksbergensis]|uniref:hypothetical protein n=1 Tax=Pseudomonas frederiksbergensis TaxID=104087 RepID=UPI00223B8840|nr:hypothetical protein [Pseudomonas frederiksbergensis]
MIQRPASGTFDLELGKLTHSGEKSFAFSTSAFFQHLQVHLISARLRPARASSEGLGWLAGTICDLAFLLGVRAPSGIALSFSRVHKKAPKLSGLFCFLAGIKKPA